MPVPQELPQARMQKPQGESKFLVQIHGGGGGGGGRGGARGAGMVMDEIDTCIILTISIVFHCFGTFC